MWQGPILSDDLVTPLIDNIYGLKWIETNLTGRGIEESEGGKQIKERQDYTENQSEQFTESVW
jgi:hypothetical protein